jgi:hypothetical protein
MSYLDYPRIHFSGQFQADPSTINNTPNNYNPAVYPEPNDLGEVELYWAPLGTSTFQFKECVVSRVDYSPTESATTSQADPIIGQTVSSVNNGGGSKLVGGVIVDLDPAQQNVSEVWGLEIQIGSGDTMIHGQFTAISFNAIWQQGQGPTTPRSSASGSAFYQSQLTDLTVNNKNSTKTSRFLTDVANKEALSINMVVNAHNNSPDTYLFDTDTMNQMEAEGVAPAIIAKLDPLKSMFMNRDNDGVPKSLGLLPTKKFTDFIMLEFISKEEYNSSYKTIYDCATQDPNPSTNCEFTWGRIYGTVGEAAADESSYFVASRMMNQTQVEALSKGEIEQKTSPCFFTPFKVEKIDGVDGVTIIINLGNALPTDTPDTGFFKAVLGKLQLVALPGGNDIKNSVSLAEIDYLEDGFMSENAGFFTFTYTGNLDLTTTPLGLVGNGLLDKDQLLLAEDPQGYYLRADQFVYRMNPGNSSPELGENNSTSIHAMKFGVPVPDNTEIKMSMMSSADALTYTLGTLGEQGTQGVQSNISTPQDALVINNGTTVVKTKGGVALFDLSCSAPGNPRDYVNGQVYFLNYGFNDSAISTGYVQDANDIVSVQVYDATPKDKTVETLQKFGRIYKVMNFLTKEENIVSINYRNLISTYLNSPISTIKHMPVTRDLSLAELTEITNQIDVWNTPPPRN